MNDAISRRNVRLLFILDKDFGELTTVMYLLKGQDWFQQSTVLLPERVYRPNKDRLELAVERYENLEDIQRVCDRDNPDIVFLCAGYLFSTHGTLSVESLEQLVKSLKHRGCTIVTCDPFMGMIGHPDFSELVDIPIPIPDEGQDVWALEFLKKSEQQRLVHNLTASREILKDIPHLYPVPTSAPDKPTELEGIHAVSFFNPSLVVSSDTIRANDEPSDDEPYWLFILARCDYDLQRIDYGVEAFAAIMANRFEDAVSAHRKAIFIAPKECIDELKGRMRVGEGVELISFCDYERFTSLLLHAEFAFYWNAVSHSILLRLLNAKPVFLFSKGHLARGVKSIYSRIIDCYYQGVEPVYLDHHSSLRLPRLTEMAQSYCEQSQRIRDHLRRSPTPDEVVETLLQLAHSK